ncbi:MAG: DNA-binding response regulator [Chloroflexi bacterium]|nr:MAG: DNA-binding response regulator [Chloroflexota bacterium]MBL1194153.1 DNA-binding response regulator [Chloroflexota bacterium]NOH11446.1 response regulator transcription factor [Chloroflexota bacterium]
MDETKILIVDDHSIVRQGLRRVLETQPDFNIVGEADDGIQVADCVEQLSPNVLILDLMLPGLNGLDVTKQIVRQSPHVQIIILSMHGTTAYVVEAINSGAQGYVLKATASQDLVIAIREVLAGRRYLSPPLSENELEDYLKKIETGQFDPWKPLSGREREVLQLLAEGHSRTEIAAQLSISERTVDSHRTHIMQKLNLENQAELYRVALSRGLILPKNQ